MQGLKECHQLLLHRGECCGHAYNQWTELCPLQRVAIGMAEAMPECQRILQAQPERLVQYRWPDAGKLSGHLREQVRMRKGAPG